MRTTIRATITAALLAMLATSGVSSPARAEQDVFFSGAYRCEQEHQVTLGKIVCRNLRQFSDYYVVYYQVDEAKGRIFTDAIIPQAGSPGFFVVDQRSMTIQEFQQLYGSGRF